MTDMTICLGMGCRIRTKCKRYGLKANTKWQSYMAACKDKEAFVGKPKWKKTY